MGSPEPSAPGDPVAPGRLRRYLTLPDWADPLLRLLLLAEWLAPFVLASLVFLGGVALLLSGAEPETFARREILRKLFPLPFAEASHLSSSLAGLALIVLARGLALRMALARLLALGVLLAGAVFVLAKGLQWEEATLLAALAVALAVTGRAFRRRGDWRAFRPTRGWLVLVAVCVVAVTLIGLLGYRNVAFRSEMWWSFAWRGDAPRFLRASLALTIAVAVLALDSLMNRPVSPRIRRHPLPDAAAAVLDTCPDSQMQVGHLGDKQVLLAPGNDAALLYAVSGRSWVCLGGPVGAAAACDALIWQFLERADRVGGRAVFYGVGPGGIARLLDLGHAIVKTGEMARIDLARFTLEGPGRKDLRYARSRAARDGLRFDILPRALVPEAIPELRGVSDAWMAVRKGGEKGFSLGRFDPDYLAHFDIAVMKTDERIVAFANLWRGADKTELAIDLMRHLPGQSPVLMDAMMTEAILFARTEGYATFSLGGAPLSGLASHPLASTWARLGTLAYRMGDEFYSFEGLRAFKQKFGPDWEPRYMTAPGGISMARALVDVTLLVSRPRRDLWQDKG